MERSEIERTYRRHRQPLVRMVARRIQDPLEAEDVVQEAFVALLGQSDRLERSCSPFTWLWTVSFRIAVDRLRRNASRRALLEREKVDLTVVPDAEARISARELLEGAPHRIRTVAIDRWMIGRSCREIAADIGCSRRNVGHMLLRFRSIARGRAV